MFKKFLILISAAAVASSIGCSAKSDQPIKTEPVVKAVQPVIVQLKITPATSRVTAGETGYYVVAGVDSTGKTSFVSANWKLTGSKTAIGTLNTSKGDKVIFTAKTPGKATLEAEYNNLKASAKIEVVKKVANYK